MGALLFRPGLMEDCIYIVQTGTLNLYLVDKNGSELLLKEVNAGENIHSVMNILDAIRGVATYRYSISIRAATDAQILRLPSKAFCRVFEDNPESLVRVVQIVMLRLQQVTFQALHKFLGLSNELITHKPARRKSSQPTTPTHTVGGSQAGRSSGASGKSEDRLSSFSPIQEVVDSSASPTHSDSSHPSPIKRTVSFTDTVQVISDQQPIHRVSSSEGIIKQKSPRSFDMSTITLEMSSSPSDFESAMDRVDLKFSIGGSEDDNSDDSLSDSERTILDRQLSEYEEEMLATAKKTLVQMLDLPTPTLLDNIVSIEKVASGTKLVNLGQRVSALVIILYC